MKLSPVLKPAAHLTTGLHERWSRDIQSKLSIAGTTQIDSPALDTRPPLPEDGQEQVDLMVEEVPLPPDLSISHVRKSRR